MNYSTAIENVKYFGTALLRKVPLNEYKVDNIAPVGFYMSNRFYFSYKYIESNNVYLYIYIDQNAQFHNSDAFVMGTL